VTGGDETGILDRRCMMIDRDGIARGDVLCIRVVRRSLLKDETAMP